MRFFYTRLIPLIYYTSYINHIQSCWIVSKSIVNSAYFDVDCFIVFNRVQKFSTSLCNFQVMRCPINRTIKTYFVLLARQCNEWVIVVGIVANYWHFNFRFVFFIFKDYRAFYQQDEIPFYCPINKTLSPHKAVVLTYS